MTLLNPLEADSYVSRQRDPADRRRHVVALSPAGATHLAAAARPSAPPRTNSSPASTTASASNSASCC